jgi:uncharacterized RDD family membrane protein YckC
MNWYYAVAGRQVGPVTDDEFNRLISAGTIQPDTLVWREGMADWQPFAQAQHFAGTSTAAVATGAMTCSECGRPVTENSAIRYGNLWVCADCKPVFVQKLKEGARPAGILQYAGFWIRFGAKVIDGLILGVPYFVIMALLLPAFSGSRGPGPMFAAQILIQGMFYVINAAYYIFFVGKFGATLGKMAVKIKIVTAEGDRVSYARATGRMFAEILSGIICYIGYLMAAFDEEKRALHDRICNTRVVKR